MDYFPLVLHKEKSGNPAPALKGKKAFTII
jgi:hypothetical protein